MLAPAIPRDRPMAKKRMGRPPKGRDDVTVKLDRTVAFQAKMVAAYRQVPVAEVLTEMLKSPVARAYSELGKKIKPAD